MRKLIFLSGFCLAACSAQTAVQDQAKIQDALNTGCQAVAAAQALLTPVTAALPQAQVLSGFAGGSCVAGQATAALITKALSDPSTQVWLNDLASQISALKK